VKKFDLIVIGSGVGLMVLGEALKLGMKCAIVENNKFGGTCLTRGCIPSKMLVYPADLIRSMERSEKIGIKSGKPEIDWDLISKRTWEQIDFNKNIEKYFSNIPNLTVYKGIAEFQDSDKIVIRNMEEKPEQLICGEKIVIATGARSHVQHIEGLESAGYLTSETFFGEKYPEKPWKSLVIVGSGSISVEFAHIFSSFGTKVTIVGRSNRILTKEEEEISEFVRNQFTHDGIDVITDSIVAAVTKDENIKHVTIENRITKEIKTVECEEILIASGTESTGDLLCLKKAGVLVDANGWIITNKYLETSQKNIWALGDINGKYQFRHKANHEALVLAKNLFGGEAKEQVNYSAVPWAIFTHPQVAHVGLTEKEVQSKNIKYKVAKNYFSEVVGGRSMGYREEDEDNGFVKMIVGENKNILGVHIVGPQAAILVQPFVYLMNSGYIGTYEVINDSMVIHPSLSELTAWVFEKIDLME
jgi:dihydrolipoamide dehydrogenase